MDPHAGPKPEVTLSENHGPQSRAVDFPAIASSPTLAVVPPGVDSNPRPPAAGHLRRQRWVCRKRRHDDRDDPHRQTRITGRASRQSRRSTC